MTKKLTLWIVGCFILSIGIVVGLLALSKDIREQPGSFLRQYPPHPVIESKSIKLADEHYYFAGATRDKIYVANTLKPLEILEINSDMSDTSVVHLKIDNIEKQKYFRITVRIDSPYYYFMDGAIPYIYRGNITDWKGGPYMKDSTYFIDAIPISSGSFVLQAMSAKTREYALGKMDVNSKEVKLNHDLLKKQFDGTFDVDGSFSYSKKSNRLVYVYYYRNQFIVMDTNLNLDYQGNTIDTFKIAQVKTAEVYSEKVVKLSAPPIITNKDHTIYGQWLLIHSLLPAKNEYMKYFHKASIIDVYDLTSNSYQFSFRIFDQDGEKIKDLRVVGNRLYVLFQNSLLSYDLVDAYFSDI